MKPLFVFRTRCPPIRRTRPSAIVPALVAPDGTDYDVIQMVPFLAVVTMTATTAKMAQLRAAKNATKG
jgi:hypothetical protein